MEAELFILELAECEECQKEECQKIMYMRMAIRESMGFHYLEDNDGSAECFPYDEIEELKNEFWL